MGFHLEIQREAVLPPVVVVVDGVMVLRSAGVSRLRFTFNQQHPIDRRRQFDLLEAATQLVSATTRAAGAIDGLAAVRAGHEISSQDAGETSTSKASAHLS